MLPIRYLASFLAFFSVTTLSCQDYMNTTSVFICYGEVNPDKIRNFKYAILEPDEFNAFEVGIMREFNQWVLGYISMGEVSEFRSYYKAIEDKTLGKNEIWDSYYLDLTDKRTREALLAVVDTIHQKGFNGLFLDTVDVFGPWGNSPDQADALASLLAEFKAKYPDLHLMQNSGIELLPKTQDYVSSLALESILTDYNFDEMKYAYRNRDGARERASSMNKVLKTYGMDVVAIEYADTKKMYKRVLSQLKTTSWEYFIGQIELDAIPKFK